MRQKKNAEWNVTFPGRKFGAYRITLIFWGYKTPHLVHQHLLGIIY